jgi:uncharacterized protein YjbI with pentapeptide repeats
MLLMSGAARDRLASLHRYATVSGESFDGADLSTVAAGKVRFERCSFRRTDFRHATLDGCGFKLCDLRYADLGGASLRGAHFAGCDLRETNFSDTDLTLAEFGFVRTGSAPYGLTDLSGAKFDGAVLRDLRVEQVIGWDGGERSRGSAR